MEILLFALIIGLIPAAIAQSKGRNFVEWWIFGSALFIIALPAAFIIKPIVKGVRKCPYCAELVKKEATVCKHCGRCVEISKCPHCSVALYRKPECAGEYGTCPKCDKQFIYS